MSQYKHFVVATLAGLAMLGAVACMPPAPSYPPGPPALGCHQHSSGNADIGYGGPTADAVRLWTSSNGTCAGSVLFVTAIVQAADPTAAGALCVGLGYAGLHEAGTLYSVGWLSMPGDAYLCLHN